MTLKQVHTTITSQTLLCQYNHQIQDNDLLYILTPMLEAHSDRPSQTQH
jgi:hypothetical protein